MAGERVSPAEEGLRVAAICVLICCHEKGRRLVLLSLQQQEDSNRALNSSPAAVSLECLTLEKTCAVKLRWLLPARQPALHSAIGKKFHRRAGQRQHPPEPGQHTEVL